VSFGEWKHKWVKFQDAEERINRDHQNLYEELDVLWFHVVGHLNLEQVRRVGDDLKDVFYCLG